MIKKIFESFAYLSGLEINEGKTKVIRIGSKLDDKKPLTNLVKFVYDTEFTLLGVNIDNKLKKLENNFIERMKKIRQKIAIWRKLNLSEIGNLIISKTFLISQLGYILSMLECPDHLMSTIQEDIDHFIFRTIKSLWMAEERRYLPPNEGGMAAINIRTYASSLRNSWYKRINTGLWYDILRAKVENLENACFIKPKDIHKMHISITPIVKAFENLNSKFIEHGNSNVKLTAPMDQLPLIKTPATRTR